MNVESGKRVTQLKWTLQRGLSWSNAGHLSTTEKSIYTHTTTQKERGEERRERKQFCARNHTIPSSSSNFCFITTPALLHCHLFQSIKSSSQTNSSPGINNGAETVFLFNVQRWHSLLSLFRWIIHTCREGGADERDKGQDGGRKKKVGKRSSLLSKVSERWEWSRETWESVVH